jgi:hypothetical protein
MALGIIEHKKLSCAEVLEKLSVAYRRQFATKTPPLEGEKLEKRVALGLQSYQIILWSVAGGAMTWETFRFLIEEALGFRIDSLIVNVEETVNGEIKQNGLTLKF